MLAIVLVLVLSIHKAYVWIITPVVSMAVFCFLLEEQYLR